MIQPTSLFCPYQPVGSDGGFAVGVLYLYGPYLRDGVETAPSNLAFDASLKGRDPRWGLRRVEDVVALAEEQDLRLEAVHPMPANNLSLVFRKR